MSGKAAKGESGASITDEMNGSERTIVDAERDPKLSRLYPFLERKLLLFGGMSPGPHEPNHR